MKTPRLPAGTASLARRVGGLAATFVALTLGLLPAQEPGTRYAWNASKFELAITIGDGADHEFQFHRLAADGDSVVYQAPGATREPGLSELPDGPAGSSLEHLDHMADALEGYRSLTEWIRQTRALPEAELKKHAANDWESQNIGFRNWPSALRETLLRQEAELADLRWRLAEASGSTAERIQALRADATRTRTALETFVKSKPPAAD